jgi:hypothetical protein
MLIKTFRQQLQSNDVYIKKPPTAAYHRVLWLRNLLFSSFFWEDFSCQEFSEMTSPGPGGSSNLPLARVKTIMKSSPEVETVTQETLFLITRATVRFPFNCKASST